MHYVYILEGQSGPGNHYVGLTADLKRRFDDHNHGRARHSAKLAPWTVAAYIGFSDKLKAMRFERYLKSESGRKFAKRQF